MTASKVQYRQEREPRWVHMYYFVKIKRMKMYLLKRYGVGFDQIGILSMGMI